MKRAFLAIRMSSLPLLLIILCLVPSSFSWPFKHSKICGVNLGSWLVLEKWITPSVFQGLPNEINDEYSLCKHLGYNEAQKRLRAHWDSWVTENDIIKLKDAGINTLRIPIGYWAKDIESTEPYVWGSWDYVVKACRWAKTHGLQVMIDLHGAPGSQNGNDHSGRAGSVDFYNGNHYNINRAVRIVAEIARWANEAEWRDTVVALQVLNEPVLWENYHFRLSQLKSYYRKAYDEIRKNNPSIVMVVHDAFIGYENWYYLRDDPRYYWIMLDTHLYQVFNNDWKHLSCEQHMKIPCEFRDRLKKANEKLWTVVGEWSLATPKPCHNQQTFSRQQIGVYESNASGWFMWNFKHGQGWKEWDFLASHSSGWIDLFKKNEAQCPA